MSTQGKKGYMRAIHVRNRNGRTEWISLLRCILLIREEWELFSCVSCWCTLSMKWIDSNSVVRAWFLFDVMSIVVAVVILCCILNLIPLIPHLNYRVTEIQGKFPSLLSVIFFLFSSRSSSSFRNNDRYERLTMSVTADWIERSQAVVFFLRRERKDVDPSPSVSLASFLSSVGAACNVSY